MAIAFDSVGSGTDANLNGTIQWAHTINSNNKGIFIALVGHAGTGNLNSSPTFAGNNLTKVNAGTSSTVADIEMWYLLNPPTGLGTFNGTFSDSLVTKGGISLAYTGVNQTTPLLGSVSGTVAAGASSGSIVDTTLGANGLFAGGLYTNIAPGTTATGVERGTIKVSVDEVMAADSTGGTLRWTLPVTGAAAMVGAELALGGSVVFNQSIGTISDSNGPLGTMTFSSQSNRALVVAAGAHQSTVGSVTLNGTVLTKVALGTTAFNENAGLWYFNAPPSGAAGTIGVFGGGNGNFFTAMEFYNVSQSGQPAVAGSITGNSSAAIGTITTNSANNMIVSSFYSEGQFQAPLNPGQISVSSLQQQSFENGASSYDTTITGASSPGTEKYSISSGQRWAMAMIVLEPPSVVVSANKTYITLLGAGNI